MPKVALMRVIGSNCYECGNEPAYAVTEWTEITYDEELALRKYIARQYKAGENFLILHEPAPREKVVETVKEAIAAELKQHEKEELEKAIRERKRARKEADNVAKTRQQKKELLKKLQEELGE